MKRLLILMLPCLLAGRQIAAAEPAPELTGRLAGGEIMLLDSSGGPTGGSARVRLFSHSTAQAFWDVIVSCDLAFRFVDGIEQCEVLEDGGARVLVHQVVDRGWLVPTQDFTFESLRDPYREIRFRLVAGNLKAMEGYWRFTETPAGVLVDYQIQIVPALPVPRFIVRRSVRKGMPDLVACVRGLAGGSVSEASRQDDLERCPGGQ